MVRACLAVLVALCLATMGPIAPSVAQERGGALVMAMDTEPPTLACTATSWDHSAVSSELIRSELMMRTTSVSTAMRYLSSRGTLPPGTENVGERFNIFFLRRPHPDLRTRGRDEDNQASELSPLRVQAPSAILLRASCKNRD